MASFHFRHKSPQSQRYRACLNVIGVELVLTRLVVEDGNPFPDGAGGCILNFGTVTLTNTNLNFHTRKSDNARPP